MTKATEIDNRTVLSPILAPEFAFVAVAAAVPVPVAVPVATTPVAVTTAPPASTILESCTSFASAHALFSNGAAVMMLV